MQLKMEEQFPYIYLLNGFNVQSNKLNKYKVKKKNTFNPFFFNLFFQKFEQGVLSKDKSYEGSLGPSFCCFSAF